MEANAKLSTKATKVTNNATRSEVTRERTSHAHKAITDLRSDNATPSAKHDKMVHDCEGGIYV